MPLTSLKDKIRKTTLAEHHEQFETRDGLTCHQDARLRICR